MRKHLLALAAALLLGGCATSTYLDAKSNTAAGGKLDQEKRAAQTDLTAARAENTRLGDEKLQRERELERNDKRIRAVEADLRRQNDVLSKALAGRQITQGRHAELKRELDTIRADTQSADMQNKSDAMGPAPDAKARAAKEQKLRELERRKGELERVLAQLAGGK